MANKRISELPEATSIGETEYTEILQSGLNKKVLTSLFGLTREFNRTFVETLVFDKHEIFHAPIVMTDDILLLVGSGLVDQASSMRFRITTDGIHSINFGPGFDFLYGITNGQILDVGTYEMYFLYTNGSVSVNVPGVSSESSSTTVLSVPTNFAAVPGTDTETELDLSWTDVANESSYLVEFSLTGIGGWATLATPAAGVTTTTHSGLTVGETRYYRIKSIGDGVSFLNSDFSEVISGQTTSASDVLAPTFIFLPASGNTTWTVNQPITLTANEPIRNADGSVITNANVATRLTLKETNAAGADIAFTATIDGAKQIITITPTTHYGENQLVYVAINNVEDVNGNAVTVAISSTFTTTDFTFFNGTTNRLQFGDILDSIFAVNDAEFWIELTLNNPSLSGTHRFISKYSSSANNRTFAFYCTNTDIYFAWFKIGTAAGGNRIIKWAGALSTGTHIFVLKYDGSIDTGDGLDRLTLLDNGGTVGSKTLDNVSLTLGNMFNSNAQLSVGVDVIATGVSDGTSFYSGEAKDFIVRSAAGSVVELNVPNLKLGTDTSGNATNGTWV